MMKITRYFAAFVALALGTACNDDRGGESTPIDNASSEYTVLASQPDPSRVSTTDGTILAWEAGDQISLSSLSLGSEYIKLQSTGSGSSVTFTGTGTQKKDIDTYYAAYPETTTIVNGLGTYTIPVAQDGKATNEGSSHALLAARTPDAARGTIEMSFAPINALLYVSIDQQVDQVVFEACAGEAVAGAYTYNFEAKSCALAGTEQQIVVTPDALKFYISVPADKTFSQGYKLTLRKGDQIMVKSFGYNTGKTFEQGTTYPIAIEWAPVEVTLGQTVSTSYSVYRADGASAANALDGSTIYLTGSNSYDVTGLSSTMRDGIDEVGLLIDGTEYPATSWDRDACTFSVGNQQMQAWKAYTLQAYVKYAGTIVALSATTTVDVTGLPYTAAPPTNTGDHPWTNESSRVSSPWTDGYATLQGISQAPSIASPYFHIPETIGIAVSSRYERYSLLPGNYEYSVSQYNGSRQKTIISNSQARGTYDVSGNGELTTDCNRLLCHYNYALVSIGVNVYNVTVNYR